ncbi:MAG: Jag N-terminal domain-containing protein [Candidatus Izimaplasma sp.]|nr:Jag N-terminal domain-containing protein [Candidatus Izimaplasma bacterium]
MRKIQFDIKSLDEALKYASKELRISEDVIEINVIDKKSMLGFVKSYTVEAVVNIDPAEIGYKTLSELFENMQLEAQIEMSRRNEREISYTINTSENPLLIGKNGKTLENIQFYIRNIVNLYSDEHLIVLVDIGGYKENRKKQLEILATKTAKEVARTRVEAKLYPMNAYERRIIHTKLSDWRDVSTISEGEGQERHLVIKPKRR